MFPKLVAQSKGRKGYASMNTISVARNIYGFVRRPGGLFRYRSSNLRAFYSLASRTGHPLTYWQRRAQAQALGRRWRTFEITDDKGYAFVPPGTVAGVDSAVSYCNDQLDTIDVEQKVRQSQKPYLVSLLEPHDIDRNSPLFRLGLDPEILGPISGYLGVLPIFCYCSIWYSPNRDMHLGGSQEFHLDHEDFRQIKVFIYLREVDERTGPLTLVEAADSDRLARKIDYRMTAEEKRVDDAVIERNIRPAAIHTLAGPEGSMVLVDTSRCFHFGSRAADKPRYVITLQYITPFAYTLPWLWRRQNSLCRRLPAGATQFERQILGVE